jgi:hypothetical protein
MLKNFVKKFIPNTNLYLWLVLIISFITKLYNLGYNSPSRDEAVYVAIGHSILFKWNWALYNTASWMGGHAYFYPIVTSFINNYYGIYGSRLLSIIFLSISVYFTYFTTNKLLTRIHGGLFRKRVNTISLLSAVIVAFSQGSIYISRLATYDVPSFTALVVGIYYLVLSCEYKIDDSIKAKNFLMSSLFLSLSIAFKYITVIYLPIIIFVSYKYIFAHFKKSLLHFWKFYFAFPLFISTSILLLTQYQYLITFVSIQTVREYANPVEIIKLFFDNTYYLIPYFVFGIIGLVKKKYWKILLAEFVSIVTIILFHLMFSRTSALDKHSFLISLAVSIFSSIGIYELFTKKIYKYIIYLIAILYIPLNIYFANRFNYLWPNFDKGLLYLQENMKPKDRLLTENGSSIMLSAFGSLSPINVTTFDWFEYKKIVGSEAYKNALKEGYFTYIELEKDTFIKSDSYKSLNKIVSDNLDINYQKVVETDDYVILKREF